MRCEKRRESEETWHKLRSISDQRQDRIRDKGTENQRVIHRPKRRELIIKSRKEKTETTYEEGRESRGERGKQGKEEDQR